jgi:hypothetical protein
MLRVSTYEVCVYNWYQRHIYYHVESPVGLPDNLAVVMFDYVPTATVTATVTAI